MGSAGRADCGYVGTGHGGGLRGDCVHLACGDAVEYVRLCTGKWAWGARWGDV